VFTEIVIQTHTLAAPEAAAASFAKRLEIFYKTNKYRILIPTPSKADIFHASWLHGL